MRWLASLISVGCVFGCVVQGPAGDEETSSESEGDGDGDTPGDGDGEPGDGDGEPGDGDGDGDPPGDGDGDGDGDEPRMCDEGLTLCCQNGESNCDDVWDSPTGENEPEWQRYGCVDTQVSRYHCGGCANECPSDDLEDFRPGRCEAAECQPIYQGCVHAETPTVTCNDVCTSLGKSCEATACGFSMRLFHADLDGCWDGSMKKKLDLGCDQPIPGEEVPAEISCCCSLE